jgi:predicted transcriptional regulator
MSSGTLELDLDEDLERRLLVIAAGRGASPRTLLQQAARDFVEREEAFARERNEDEARYQHYVGTGEAFDHSAVTAWLDSLETDNPLPPPHRQS